MSTSEKRTWMGREYADPFHGAGRAGRASSNGGASIVVSSRARSSAASRRGRPVAKTNGVSDVVARACTPVSVLSS